MFWLAGVLGLMAVGGMAFVGFDESDDQDEDAQPQEDTTQVPRSDDSTVADILSHVNPPPLSPITSPTLPDLPQDAAAQDPDDATEVPPALIAADPVLSFEPEPEPEPQDMGPDGLHMMGNEADNILVGSDGADQIDARRGMTKSAGTTGTTCCQVGRGATICLGTMVRTPCPAVRMRTR